MRNKGSALEEKRTTKECVFPGGELWVWMERTMLLHKRGETFVFTLFKKGVWPSGLQGKVGKERVLGRGGKPFLTKKEGSPPSGGRKACYAVVPRRKGAAIRGEIEGGSKKPQGNPKKNLKKKGHPFDLEGGSSSILPSRRGNRQGGHRHAWRECCRRTFLSYLEHLEKKAAVTGGSRKGV